MNPSKKKIKYFLKKFDALWSFPATILAFWLIGMVIQYFDVTAGSYDLADFQPLILAVGIIIGAVNATLLGMKFTFRRLYEYIYGYVDENGKTVNKSVEDFNSLLPWQRFIVALLPFFFLLYLIVSTYHRLIGVPI